MRRTKAAQIYKKTGNLRAVQLLLGHTKMDSTVRYLGIELEDALEISERIEIAAMAARRDGRPARISIAIMNCGTPVSTAAAAPPATVSGDQPRDMRRVRTASSAQTRR
jgi:hypothetical protein